MKVNLLSWFIIANLPWIIRELQNHDQNLN